MKIRLLAIFAAIMAATSIGWATITDVPKTIYVNSSGNDSNNGLVEAESVQTIAKAIELATDGDLIQVAAGTYTLTGALTVDKDVTISGVEPTAVEDIKTRTFTTIIQSAAEQANSINLTKANGQVTIKNCKLVDNRTCAGASAYDVKPLISLNNEAISFTLDNSEVAFMKPSQAAVGHLEGTDTPNSIGILTINNSYIHNTQTVGTGRSGCFYMWNTDPIIASGETESIHIIDSEIAISGYVVGLKCNNNTNNIEKDIDIQMRGTTVQSWSLLYLAYGNPQVTIDGCDLTGAQISNNKSDAFGLLAFQQTDGAHMTVNNSVVTSTMIETIFAASDFNPILFKNIYKNTTVELTGNSVLRSYITTMPSLISYGKDGIPAPITAESGVKFYYNKDGIDYDCILLKDKDDNLKNAYIAETDLKDIPSVDGDKVVFPEGTFTLSQSFTLDKSLTIEGAGKDKTIIKGHIEVNPEEGETATLTAKGLTLEGSNNSAAHGIIGIIGAGTGKVDLTDCKILGGTLTGGTAAVGVRMESAGAELAMTNTDIDVYVYGLGLREKKQKVTINGGAITARAAIMTSAGGLNGYLEPTETSITATGTTFIGKTIAKGENESYGTIVLQEKYNGVKGEFTNCEIKTVPAVQAVADAEKQMSALCVRSYGNTLNFKDTKLSAVYAENNIEGINSKIHAAVIQLGWHNADFKQSVAGATELKGDDASVPSQNTIALTNCELTIKEGEKYLATTYRRDINQKHDALTINGTAYSVEAGNVLKLYQVNKDGKFVDDNGNVILQVTDLATLKSIMASAADGSTIHLSSNITGITEGDLPIVINKAITLEGNGFTLAGTYTSGGGTALKHLLDIRSDNVVIRNLTVEKAPRSGINVYEATDVTLENVVSQNNAGVGLTVNSSKVTATNLTTSGNGWKAGVNVDKGKNVESNPVFTFSNSSFGEEVAIYSDLPDAPLSYVVAPANSGWTKHANQGDEVKKTIWKIDALVPTITTTPEIKVNLLEAGQTLSSVLLVKGVAQYNNVAIAGTFSWINPAEIIKAGKYNYKALFTPSDLIKYAVVECEVSIEADQYYTVTTGVCQNGKVSIANGNVNNRYVEGTELTLTSTPDAGYRLKVGTLAAKMTVTKDETITAEFEAIQQTVTLQVDGGNGSISVNGQTNHGGSVTVQQGREIVVQAIPSSGYVVESLLCTNGKVISKDAVTVDKDFTITAKFKTLPPSEYSVKVTSPANGKILLFDGNGNAIAAGSSVVKGTVVSVLAVADEGYKLQANSLKNNESEITNGVVTVNADAAITAVFEIQQFEVKASIPSGEGTITLTQGENTSFTSGNTVNYGQTMKAKVAPADGYKLLSLLVNGKEIPDGGSFTVKAATTVEAVMRKLATITIDETPQTFVYNNTDKAFAVKTTPAGISGFAVTYSATPKDVGSYNVTIKRDADDTYAAFNKTITGGLVITQAEMKGVAIPTAESGTIQTESADGSVIILNGNSQLSDGDLYVGQKIRLRAIPGTNASANVTWGASGGTLSGATGNEVTLTLGEGANVVTATFATKEDPAIPIITGELTYNGGIQVPTISSATDWQIIFKQGNQIIQNPTEAGTYEVIGSYPEDANYKAVDDKKIGTFTIKPQKVTATVTAASSILQGQSLAQSVITGNANADGAFEWNTDTKNTPIITSGTQTSQPIKFVPTSSNYEELTGLSTSVEVTEVKNLTLRTLNLTVINPDGGTVTMTLNGQEVNSGATITAGDKLTVGTSPKSNYTATVSVVGATKAEGVYTVGDAGNVEVKVTFTQKSTPGGDDDDDDEPEAILITGVTLDPSSKTVAAGEEFKLTASVKPANADQSVTWSSSDETVATVKDGTVKALKNGMATITATASDDTHYAECEVTVTVATGIDELLASTRVLGHDGYITIEPIAAVETLVSDMMGRIIYHGQLTEKIQLPVSEGVYLIRLSNNEKAVTVKVIVR